MSEETLPLTEKQLETLTITKLKDVLRYLGLGVGGNKPVLIERILAYGGNDEGKLLHIKEFIMHMMESDPNSRWSAIAEANYLNALPYNDPGSLRGVNPNTYINSPSVQIPDLLHGRYSQEVPLHFKHTVFYEFESRLPGSIVLRAHSERKRAQTVIALTAEQENQIFEGKYSVCMLSAVHSKHADGKACAITFPQAFELRLNDDAVPTSTKGIKNKPGTAVPVDLTEPVKLKLRAKRGRRLHVDYIYADKSNDYWVAWFLSKRRPMSKILESLSEQPMISSEWTVKDIQEKSADDELEMGPSVESLRDPVSGMRMKIPVRSYKCDHMSCFDAEPFLQLQLVVVRSVCPVCNKAIEFDDLRISEYMSRILAETIPEVDEVEILPDGTWKAREPEGQATSDGPAEPADNHAIEIIDFSDSETDTESPARAPQEAQRESAPAPSATLPAPFAEENSAAKESINQHPNTTEEASTTAQIDAPELSQPLREHSEPGESRGIQTPLLATPGPAELGRSTASTAAASADKDSGEKIITGTRAEQPFSPRDSPSLDGTFANPQSNDMPALAPPPAHPENHPLPPTPPSLFPSHPRMEDFYNSSDSENDTSLSRADNILNGNDKSGQTEKVSSGIPTPGASSTIGTPDEVLAITGWPAASSSVSSLSNTLVAGHPSGERADMPLDQGKKRRREDVAEWPFAQLRHYDESSLAGSLDGQPPKHRSAGHLEAEQNGCPSDELQSMFDSDTRLARLPSVKDAKGLHEPEDLAFAQGQSTLRRRGAVPIRRSTAGLHALRNLLADREPEQAQGEDVIDLTLSD